MIHNQQALVNPHMLDSCSFTLIYYSLARPESLTQRTPAPRPQLPEPVNTLQATNKPAHHELAPLRNLASPTRPDTTTPSQTSTAHHHAQASQASTEQAEQTPNQPPTNLAPHNTTRNRPPTPTPHMQHQTTTNATNPPKHARPQETTAHPKRPATHSSSPREKPQGPRINPPTTTRTPPRVELAPHTTTPEQDK